MALEEKWKNSCLINLEKEGKKKDTRKGNSTSINQSIKENQFLISLMRKKIRKSNYKKFILSLKASIVKRCWVYYFTTKYHILQWL